MSQRVAAADWPSAATAYRRFVHSTRPVCREKRGGYVEAAGGHTPAFEKTFRNRGIQGNLNVSRNALGGIIPANVAQENS